MVEALLYFALSLGLVGCWASVFFFITEDFPHRTTVKMWIISIVLMLIGLCGLDKPKAPDTCCQCPHNTFTNQQGTKTK